MYQESNRVPENGDGATALVEALDRLPLAIVQAGAWLRDRQDRHSRQGFELFDLVTTDVGQQFAKHLRILASLGGQGI